jgi:hypothetical protein
MGYNQETFHRDISISRIQPLLKSPQTGPADARFTLFVFRNQLQNIRRKCFEDAPAVFFILTLFPGAVVGLSAQGAAGSIDRFLGHR